MIVMLKTSSTWTVRLTWRLANLRPNQHVRFLTGLRRTFKSMINHPSALTSLRTVSNRRRNRYNTLSRRQRETPTTAMASVRSWPSQTCGTSGKADFRGTWRSSWRTKRSSATRISAKISARSSTPRSLAKTFLLSYRPVAVKV